MTDLSRASGRTTAQLAITASRLALADAGLQPHDVGAVLTYHLGDTAPVNSVAASLGLSPETWTNELYGGGTQCASILGDAAMLIESGTASTVLVYRALNGRSGARMGQAALRFGTSDPTQFTLPYGMVGPVHLFALAAQRYLGYAATTESDLAAVVLQSRALACDNPAALMRQPLSHAQYLESPYVATPLRRVDCCLETDGAAALVVTRSDIAAAQRPRSPRIHAVVRGGGPGSSAMDKASSVDTIFSAHVSARLYRSAGMTPDDIDIASLYDAYSFLVLKQLEDFGFAPPGQAGSFVRSGQAMLGGRLPMNLHGGLLSEGYVHGLNNVTALVQQLRGDAPANQARDPEVGLVTGFGGSYGSAAILTASR
jgi:acetyl-CoA acetyltransferase